MKDKYTVIIPTMWRSPDYIVKMLQLYCKSNYVYEVIIIDNDESQKIKSRILHNKKIRIITNNRNLYVNPSWNWGVSQTKTEKIIIANDDIFINKFEDLMDHVDRHLNQGMVIGPLKSCYSESDSKLHIDKCEEIMSWGWGTFMIMHRESYKYIPSELLIWHGDDIQFYSNEPYIFRGVHIETKMSTTIRSTQAKTLARKDTDTFKKYYNKTGALVNFKNNTT